MKETFLIACQSSKIISWLRFRYWEKKSGNHFKPKQGCNSWLTEKITIINGRFPVATTGNLEDALYLIGQGCFINPFVCTGRYSFKLSDGIRSSIKLEFNNHLEIVHQGRICSKDLSISFEDWLPSFPSSEEIW